MDAAINTSEGRLKLRVSGIIIHDNKILLEEYDGDTLFFPGGTVNFYETSEDAIKRELLEEVDKEFVIDGLVSINEEYYYNAKNSKTHCINFYYKMKFKNPNDADSIDMDRVENDHGYMCQHHYKWIDLSDLKNVDLVPVKMKEQIIDNNICTHNVINDL